MKKAEFIAYLKGIKLGCTAVDEAQIWDEILTTAARIEPETITVPQYPYPNWPTWEPQISWGTSWNDNKIELDNQSDFEYNGIKIKKDPLCGPNEWKVKCSDAPNFTVVK